MKKKQKTRGQILTATALKVTPLLLVTVMGANYLYQNIYPDFKGTLELHGLDKLVISQQGEQSKPLIDFDFNFDFWNNGNQSEDSQISQVETTEAVIEEPVVDIDQISTKLLDSGYEFQTVDWTTLHDINQDVVAYCVVDGTHISLPVVQSSDNQDYLHTSVYGNSDAGGTPMVDYRSGFSNDIDELADHTLVYGHHMSGSRMFADFAKYETQAYLDQHPFVMMYTSDGQAYMVEIFAFSVVDGSSDYALHVQNFTDVDDFNGYLYGLRKNSPIHADIDVNYGDRLMSFITCTYGYGENKRAVVTGKVTKVLVDEQLLQASNIDYEIVR